MINNKLNNKKMNKIILILALMTIMSCSETKQNEKIPEYKNNLQIEHIMGVVDEGLTQIKLNDRNTILIYKGMQSCTMIEIK